MNSAEVKAMALKYGADIVGIASMASFAGTAAANHPQSIFKQGRCVIVIGRRILRGTTQINENCNVKKNDPYHFFGFTQLEDQFLAKTTYDLGIWIESQGFEAVPIFGYDAEAAGRFELADPVVPGKAAPNVYVDYRIAAQAAGLGSIGRHGLFITPEFGTLQRFAMLICDDDLECDQPCEYDFCCDCQRCIESCPLQALIKHDSSVQRLDQRCKVCSAGAIPTDIGRFETVDRFAAICSLSCNQALKERNILTHCTTDF
ncbi:MAG: hypothetical protein E7047_00210 [Lentisphaerae bacterium]|nr:hypothetical protein [Lentisphaerota bacterium]